MVVRFYLRPELKIRRNCVRQGRSLIQPISMLLHVFVKISLLGVALAAILTDMGLQVLTLLVLGDVLQEGSLIHETLVASVTLVRFVGLVGSRVTLQVRKLTEGLVATRTPAFIGFVPRVCTDVLLKVRQLGELPLADLAAERFDAKMDPGMLGEVGAVGELFVALRALVGLGFTHVALSVHLQVTLAGVELEEGK